MRTSEEMYCLVDEYLQSGLSQKAFCKQVGISASTFGYWFRKKKTNDGPAPGFIKIDTSCKLAGGDSFEIIYPNGVRLKAGKSELSFIGHLIRLY